MWQILEVTSDPQQGQLIWNGWKALHIRLRKGGRQHWLWPLNSSLDPVMQRKPKKKRSMRRVDCSSGSRSDVPRAMQAPKRSALQTGCVCPSKAIPESERGALCQIKAYKVTITKCYTGCGIFYWEEQHWETWNWIWIDQALVLHWR